MTALSAFSEIAHSADRVLRRDPGYQAELIAWTHADAAPDGVPVSEACIRTATCPVVVIPMPAPDRTGGAEPVPR